MKTSNLVPLLGAGLVVVFLACADTPTDPVAASPDEVSAFTPASLASMGATHTPISFVTTNTGLCSDPVFRPNGKSGRGKFEIGLVFDVTGDVVGDACILIDANTENPAGPQNFSTNMAFVMIDGCIPSRGICGVWEGHQPGRLESGTGVANRNHAVLLGIEGDATGTKILLESFLECSPPGAGCAEGVLLEPNG